MKSLSRLKLKRRLLSHNEDFADQRSFPVGIHNEVVRLRVWPTTAEQTQRALERLFKEITENELRGALVIIDRSHIRIRQQS